MPQSSFRAASWGFSRMVSFKFSMVDTLSTFSELYNNQIYYNISFTKEQLRYLQI